MAAEPSLNVAELLREHLQSAGPDLFRAMVKTVADVRDSDTRAGTVELAIAQPRQGSYSPDWLLQHRRGAEQALISVVAISYLPGSQLRPGRRAGHQNP
jgi:putative transposase